MPESLIDRYVSPFAVHGSIGREIVHEAPRRHRDLVHRQIEAQKAAVGAIASSNLAGARLIERELEQQTSVLLSALKGLEESTQQGFAVMEAALDRLGDRLCASLDEIKWQLAQQGRTLESILQALTESRNAEAQQLVRQGIRHFVNGEYQEAGERFGLALTFDTTDYQVLLNLAFLSIHEDNSSRAHQFFRKALTLPTALGNEAKARVIWATARLHYAGAEYEKALERANSALLMEHPQDASSMYTVAVYQGLAGLDAIPLLRNAIRLDPTLFAKAASDPDFTAVRSQVNELLSSLAIDALDGARSACTNLKKHLDGLQFAAHSKGDRELLDKALRKTDDATKLLSGASYSDCVRTIDSTQDLSKKIDNVGEIGSAFREEHEASEQAVAAAERTQTLARRVGRFAWLILAGYPLTGLAGGLGYALAGGTAGPTTDVDLFLGPELSLALGLVFGAILWPLGTLITIVRGARNPAEAAALGAQLLAVLVWGGCYLILYVSEGERVELAARIVDLEAKVGRARERLAEVRESLSSYLAK